MYSEGDTEMNEGQPPSIRSSQVPCEGGGEPVPEGRSQCCGRGKKEGGAEGTHVNLGPSRLELRACWLAQGGQQVQVRSPRKWSGVSRANMAAVGDIVAFGF